MWKLTKNQYSSFCVGKGVILYCHLYMPHPSPPLPTLLPTSPHPPPHPPPQVLILEIKSFDEVITIGHKKYHEHNLPWYRVLNW